MNKLFRYGILSILFISSSMSGVWSEFEKLYMLGLSISTFHISGYYNAWKHGNIFNFAMIARDNHLDGNNKIIVDVTSQGTIRALHDGKKTPLILGSIPRTKAHISALRTLHNLASDERIHIFSLNKKFERDWAGLSSLILSDTTLVLCKYPTIDAMAPAFIDIIRAVRDLESRDERNCKIAYVHCKAGITRSALTIVAYLVHVLHKAGYAITVDHAEAYLKKCRPHISLGKKRKKVVERFYTELKKAGSFDALYVQYQDAAERRDRDVMKL
jgi:protein-tyrosine phosphatase